jgi:hypothetical protein
LDNFIWKKEKYVNIGIVVTESDYESLMNLYTVPPARIDGGDGQLW